MAQYVGCLCGGHVSSGESIEEATTKESFEELGIKIDLNEPKLIGGGKSIVQRNGIIDKMHNYFFVVHRNFDAKKCNLQLEEVQEVKWVHFSEVKRMIVEGFKELTDKQGCHEAIVEYIDSYRKA